MNSFRHVRWGWLLVMCCLWTGFVVAGETTTAAGPYKVAMVPFANYTDHSQARDLLEPRLVAGLREGGLTVVTSADLRPLLRQHRIRSQGMIGRAEAVILTRELDLDYLLLGSWDVLGEGGNPELGCSVRVLDLQSLRLVRAVSVGMTGQDHVGMLGLGAVDSLTVLADRIVADVLHAVLPLTRTGDVTPSGPLYAVVELDNLSDMDHAGEICTGILVSRLMKAGYGVLEPGYLRELQLDLETGFRGRIDRQNMRALVERYPVHLVITGTVDVLARAVGNSATSAPRVALGLRVIDPRTGLVRMTREIAFSGADHPGWFQQGRVHGLSEVATEAFDEFVNELDRVDPTLAEGMHP